MKIRITRGRMADSIIQQDRGELSISLTGHCEERLRHRSPSSTNLDVVPVSRFSFIRRYPGTQHRVAGRSGGRAVVELIL